MHGTLPGIRKYLKKSSEIKINLPGTGFPNPCPCIARFSEPAAKWIVQSAFKHLGQPNMDP